MQGRDRLGVVLLLQGEFDQAALFGHSFFYASGEQVEGDQLEAMLNVISSIDKPGSPAGEAKSAFHNALYGRTAEQQRRYRLRVLEVGLEDLRRVGERYLRPELASQAVITSPAALEQYGDLGMQVERL